MTMVSPSFQAYLLRYSVFPSEFTLKGPSSSKAPYPSEEQPGPVNFKHYVVTIIGSRGNYQKSKQRNY